MLSYDIIFSDLDGTLFDSNMRISKENLAALRQYQQMGGLLVPTTGRCYYELPEQIRAIREFRYFLCSNGADIYDREKEEHIHMYLTGEEVGRLFSILDEYDTYPLIHYKGRAYCDADRQSESDFDHYNLSPYYRVMIRDCISFVSQFSDFCHGLDSLEMFCPFFHSTEEMVVCRERLLAEGFTVAASEKHNLEIFSSAAGKGRSLIRFAEHLGIPRQRTIAVGDSSNDVSMIEAAGLGLAVENAWPVLKEKADRVICHHDEPILKYILDNIL